MIPIALTGRGGAVVLTTLLLATVPTLGSAADHRVGMHNMTYAPSTLSAKRGDTIRLVNDDTDNHVVLVPTNGFAVELGTQKPGEERSLALSKAGTFQVECVVHPSMQMTVTVAP